MIGTTNFVWTVSEDSGYSILVVQSAVGAGQKLEVIIKWPDAAPGTEDALLGPFPITPKVVALTVEAAIDLGWRPQRQDSKAFCCRRTDDDVLVRTGSPPSTV